MRHTFVALLAVAAGAEGAPRLTGVSRRAAVIGGLGTLAARTTRRCEASEMAKTYERYLPAGGPGGPALTVSKAEGVERLRRARSEFEALRKSYDDGGKLCAAEGFSRARDDVMTGASNVAMSAEKEAYSVINLKRTIMRSITTATSPECDEMALQQSVDSSLKSIDEIIRIANVGSAE